MWYSFIAVLCMYNRIYGGKNSRGTCSSVTRHTTYVYRSTKKTHTELASSHVLYMNFCSKPFILLILYLVLNRSLNTAYPLLLDVNFEDCNLWLFSLITYILKYGAHSYYTPFLSTKPDQVWVKSEQTCLTVFVE
jgi:hypothetical protein